MLTMEDALEKLGLDWPRSSKMRCPAHDDKTPSLHLYRDKGDERGGSFYCFSCGRSGDAIGFIALMTGEDVKLVYARQMEGQLPREFSKDRPRKLTPYQQRSLLRRRMHQLNAWFFPKLRRLIDVDDDAQLEEHLYYWAFQYEDLKERVFDEGVPPAEVDGDIDALERRMQRALAELEAAQQV